MRGSGRAMFAAILLLIAGTLNIIYGIGALDSANIFVNDQRFIFTDLNTMGWVLIVIGAIQFTGGLSLLAGSTYGRVIGIIGAASARSPPCSRSAAPTRGGHWPFSRCASTSSTASTSSERTNAGRPTEPWRRDRVSSRVGDATRR